MAKRQTVEVLVARCQEDQQAQAQGSVACLQLFQLALVESDEAAWAAIQNQFATTVVAWVHRHPRYYETGEIPDYFMNGAFARLWQFGRPHAASGKFVHLGQYLSYLKRCVHSVIIDHLDKLQRDALWRGVEIDTLPLKQPEADKDEQQTTEQLMLFLDEIVAGSEQEKLVADAIWKWGMKPRELLAAAPEQFKTTKEISNIRRNILKRLQRKIEQNADVWHKNDQSGV